MYKKYANLFEEPTIYKHDYTPKPLYMVKIEHQKIPDFKQDVTQLHSKPQFYVAHDTLQQLNYDKKIPFNALWETKDTVDITVKPTFKRKVLGDSDLEHVIKTRPRRFMTPAISLDDVKDPKTRKLMIDFTYTSSLSRAAKEVWGKFEPEKTCLAKCNLEKLKESTDKKSICAIPIDIREAAKKWDAIQDRSFLCTTSKAKQIEQQLKEDCEKKNAEIEKENRKKKIKELIGNDRLGMSYDKYPLSYGGFRPYIGIGAPLEKNKLPVVHPDLSVTQVLFERYTDDPSF